MTTTDLSQIQELPVTFHPPLYLQRRGWVLDAMRQEGITEVLDIGCGEGELLRCLCNPAPWLAPPSKDIILPATYSISSSPDNETCTEALAELHRGMLHPVKIAGLDISLPDLECTADITRPLPSEPENAPHSWHTAPVRWEPLQVNIWQGSLAHVNPAFIAVECIVATEVIEHLPADVLDRFAPVVLGAYHPRILLITTPSFTFNARFTAPNAPPKVRSGWRDPTGRTERVFRHHDHKFEWTPREFEQWCNGVADEWGYEVEIGGVGKAQEVDEWGRDDELGWASQVASFRRRESKEWEEKRARRWEVFDDLHRSTQTSGAHRLLTSHHHTSHAAARNPKPLDMIGALVVSRMAHFRETIVPLSEMWFEREVELACGGWVDWLIRAIFAHDGLALQKSTLPPRISEEWVIQLQASFHHRIPPEPRTEPWISPHDSDEVTDPMDPYDEDDNTWATEWECPVVRNGAEDSPSIGSWEKVTECSWGWDEPGVDWGVAKA